MSTYKTFVQAALFGIALAQGATMQEPDDHSTCTVSCSPTTKEFTDKDGHTNKPCKCEAQNNKGCDKDGKRTTEGMANCVNGEHCKKGCCHCCPRD